MSGWGSVYFTLFAADLDAFFRGLGSEFTGKRAKLGWGDAVTVVTVITVIGAIVFLLSRHLAKNEHRRLNNPNALFRELCKAHGLKVRDRLVMWRLARFHRLDHPARLFLEPERFDTALGHPKLQAYSKRLHDLREELFREPAGISA